MVENSVVEVKIEGFLKISRTLVNFPSINNALKFYDLNNHFAKCTTGFLYGILASIKSNIFRDGCGSNCVETRLTCLCIH